MVKLFFAGSEVNLELIKQVKPKGILLSYFYLKDKHLNLSLLKDYDIFLDSGAHSFQQAGGGKNIDFNKFFKEYLNFLSENYQDLFTYVELDIDDVVGYSKVKEWQNQLKEYGLNPICVWHRGRDWKEMVRDNDYIGLTSIGDNLSKRDIIKMVSYAFENGTKVHGFAITSSDLIKLAPFYSVDSTSWLSGGRFGTFYIFEDNQLKSYTKHEFGKRFGKAFNKLNHKKMNKWNLTQWKKYAEYLDTKEEIWNIKK